MYSLLKKMINRKQQAPTPFIEKSSKEDITLKKQCITDKLNKTVDIFSHIYSVGKNNDVIFRKFHVQALKKDAALLFINTITDTDHIEEYILKSIQQYSGTSQKVEDIVTTPGIKKVQVIEDVIIEINKGNAALFIDGESVAYILSVSNFQGRGIEKAENEVVVKGPKEAFNEKANTNISLIRKKIKTESLVVESVTVSKRSKNEVYILYLKDIVNEELLSDVKERLCMSDVDSIQNLSMLEQRIEDSTKSLFPTILYTERPDRASSFLEDGYIVLLMDNSPASLVLPATFWSFFHTSEDHYLRFLYGNFTRALRLLAMFITLLISALYIAITNYHAEMLPPDLLLAISSTREIVAFPAVVEVFLMEFAFELIKEAGLRVPSPIGPTIGIVGALILGQAAVQANLVSPIVVIVVALGGLTSFAIGDLALNFAVRLSRFFLIISASLFGLYGLTAMFSIGLFYLVSLRSFGVPYLAPMTPKYTSGKDTLFRRLIFHEMFRPGYLKPQDMKKAGEVSDGKKQG
ncbi:spore germination protein [Fictibacillus sp. BK138]|uniref:spore germination protein n=1 Tax=Fictibacillus sp. BK138 TaxID=2512121 RepID=UPI0010D8BE8F|nr:spore germination protein [Fictibacillus sp. BK138]RZT23761.1 spore germination protein KA [Fictibacillus sp. BK138]